MGTINAAFSMMSQALNADQSALNIVANNVANANTPGYAKQIPNWQENHPIFINGVSYGTGVTETGAMSVRDRVLTERLNQQQQLASASGSRLSALNTLQAMFTPASGSTSSTAGDIGSDITGFFNSFSSLEANPTNSSLREKVLSSASTLAGDVSNAAASLNAQRSALNQQTTGVVSQVNALTGAIAQLNLQIHSTSPNADAGTLEDQRQQDLNQLSQLIGINQIRTDNNGLSITTTSGQLLVSGDSSFQLTSGTANGVTHFFLGTADVTAQLTSGGGSLGGALTARDQDIPSVLTSLDQLAYSVSTQVNSAQQRRNRCQWRDWCGHCYLNNRGMDSRYFFSAVHPGRKQGFRQQRCVGQRSIHERGHDRPQSNCRRRTWRREPATTQMPWSWRIWRTSPS